MQTKCEVGKLKKGVSHTEDLESMWSYHLRTYTWHCTVCSVWLWNPMDCSPSGSSVHGIFPAILERAAISSSGDLAHTGTEPVSLALAGRFFTTLSHLESPRTYRHKEENHSFLFSFPVLTLLTLVGTPSTMPGSRADRGNLLFPCFKRNASTYPVKEELFYSYFAKSLCVCMFNYTF